MSDWSICVDCVHEIYLREQLAFDLDPTLKCSFCEGQGASPADSFVEPFMAAVRREYGSPDDAAMPLDPESYSGYWIDPKGSQDLFANEFSEAAEPAVLEKVADEYFDEWWTAWDWATGTVDKMLEDAWVSFTRAIQERSRFLAVLVPPATSFPDEIKPRELLDQIAKFAESYDLIKRLPAGSTHWRVRVDGNAQPDWGAGDIGTPPVEYATSANRMSPIGIPMFYGSDDLDTALLEATQHSRGDEFANAGEFRLSADVWVLDLSDIGPIPSRYDPTRTEDYRALTFLHRFASHLKFPSREQWQDVDYIPTQVITEYFLRVYQGAEKVDGIRYASRFDGKPCTALDVPNDRCVPMGTPQPELGWFEKVPKLRLEMLPAVNVRKLRVVAERL